MTDLPRLHDFLRLRTEAEHALIEGAMPVLAPDFTIASYTSLLRRLLGFYQPFEALIEDQLGQHCELAQLLLWDARKKRRWIEEDLRAMDRSVQLASVVHCEDLPKISSVNHVVGALYVTEGSTLGGTFIERHLRARAEFEPLPLRFFSSHQQSTGKMWRSFLSQAEALVKTDGFEEAASAAVDTFRKLNAWLTVRT
jgi:heme oxygenase